MKYLTNEHWSNFRIEKNSKNNGLKFEELIKQLLFCEYPNEEWKDTPPSWDGKKDFFYESNQNGIAISKWAECKMHSNNLSINIIAPTLIMSTLKNINEIIFFSYSKLNRNAKETLALFSKVHTKKIIIYDDEKLEDLIFKHRNKISFNTFFSSYIGDAVKEEDKCVKTYETVFVPRHNKEYTIEEFKKAKVRVNEVIVLNIYIENYSNEQIPLVLSYNLISDGSIVHFQGSNNQISFNNSITLEACGISVASFSFKLIKYSTQYISLPIISLCIRDKKSYTYKGVFRSEWLLDTPLIGYQNFLDTIMEHYSSHMTSVVVLYGSSGTGKTRLIKEVSNRFILHKSKYLFINAEQTNNNGVTMLKKIVADLYALPILKVDQLDLDIDGSDAEKTAMKILYSDLFSVSYNITSVVATILSKLSEIGYLLVIDNVQALDDFSIQVFNEMINQVDTFENVSILFTFNTDYLINSRLHTNFFHRIKKLYQDDKLHYLIKEITGFNEEQSVMYVKHCFGASVDYADFSSSSYDTAIRKIAQIAQNNPFFLEQILLELCRTEVIKNNGDYFYIYNNKEFSNTLETLPRDLFEYFDKRWQYLNSSKPDFFSKATELISILSFFNELPREMLCALNFDNDTLDCLFDIGFIRRENKLVFHHQLIAHFCYERMFSISNHTMKKIIHALNQHHLRNEYPAQYFILTSRLQNTDKNLVQWAIDQLLKNKIPDWIQNEYNLELYKTIENNNMFSLIDVNNLVSFYKNYCYHQKKTGSSIAACKCYENIYKNILQRDKVFYMAGTEFFSFIKEYLNVLLTQHQALEAVDLIYDLKEKLQQFTFNDPKDKMLSLSMLLNRQHVALNRIETPTNNNGVTVSKLALDCIKKSFKIAYDLQDADQLIQNYIDFGNVYFYSGGLHSNKAISYWKKAYYIFVNNKSKVAGWECGVCYHMAIVATLEHDYEAAIEMIERVNFAYKKDLSIAYYYSKSEILRSIIMLMQKKSFEDVLLVINNVENLCQLTENVGPLTICSYIKAKTYELLKQDYETASIFYHKALEQYITLCETSLEEEKASIYLIDISIALRRLNVTINDEIISRVKTLQLKRELYYILTIEDDKRTILKNGYLEKSPFYNISQTIVYPCP